MGYDMALGIGGDRSSSMGAFLNGWSMEPEVLDSKRIEGQIRTPTIISRAPTLTSLLDLPVDRLSAMEAFLDNWGMESEVLVSKQTEDPMQTSTLISRAQTSLLDLPVELVIDILGFLPWEDYYSIKQSSHALRDIADAPKSLSETRYAMCPLMPQVPVARTSLSAPQCPRIHKILTCASIRRGQSYFSVSRRVYGGLAGDRVLGQREIPATTNKSRLSRSPFRHDPLCSPSVPKLNVVWVFGDEGHASTTTYQMTVDDRAWYGAPVMRQKDDLDVVVGTGFREEDGELKTFVTVEDLFDSFQRCRPEFGRRKSGRVKFYASWWRTVPDEANGEEGELEIRWIWVSEGFDEGIIRSLAGYPA